MCDTCGCYHPDNKATFRKPGEEEESSQNKHTHNHAHPHAHLHIHENYDDSDSRVVKIEKDVLSVNNLLAERNRGYFEAKNIKTLNLVSAPGSGKTTLLEKTILFLQKDIDFYIIEGDQQTMNDSERISVTGAKVIQINTGNGCHLDAGMINTAIKKLSVADNSLLVIENVGNLVCPALFDLGEAYRVVIMSVTEGDDKPLKYPNMFHTSDICIINKTDLLAWVDFDIAKAKDNALKTNHHLKFFELSAKTGEGMNDWYEWLRGLR